MGRNVAIGIQDFEKLIESGCFYVDKTSFIREWWESNDDVTLITRPRRFGKTLNMNMLERFFSNKYKGNGGVFEGLDIWKEQKYRDLQGTYPVISLTFADVKETTCVEAKKSMKRIIARLYSNNCFLKENGILNNEEINYFNKVLSEDIPDGDATEALRYLSEFLFRYYNEKVIVLLDEYDTPMQEAYINGFWDELVAFVRSLFHKTFKTNPYMHRAVMTGITRVSRESMFSDLNNMAVVTTTSNRYATAFGFTEEEVFAAMDEQGLTDKAKVKEWYDGFTFGKRRDIYNPWSIINYLKEHKIGLYWVNTSGNGLVNSLIRKGGSDVKTDVERLMNGESLHKCIDEQIVYNELDTNPNAIWSLFVASGYLRLDNATGDGDTECDLSLTNKEVLSMFRKMVTGWFGVEQDNYNNFIKALLLDDRRMMNRYINRVTMNVISYFDSGNSPSETEPERFYHGLVLGLMVDLSDRYTMLSNRESGFGRYDIMLTPKNDKDDAIIIEFKVYDEYEEKSLEDTVQAALAQIENKKYDQNLIAQGIPSERIRKYGFAFQGKTVLIG
jgi:hypothetical protein